MDTTLITFHLQTSYFTNSVHLIGSWDNFVKRYPMERDIKRAKGQWRGCYTFENIICDGDGGTSPKRTGGLKMGSTYYYYYELGDGTEIHDPSLPSTTSCPYLPGQSVNLLSVPVEVQPLRYRSASLSSMANMDLMTMNPTDKFMTPRQPPPLPSLPRLNTSSMVLQKKRSSQSLSPKSEKPHWLPRSFFGLRAPALSTPEPIKRGRSPPLKKTLGSRANVSVPTLRSYSSEQQLRPLPHPRDASPQSYKRSNSHPREPSPLRKHVVIDTSSSHTSSQLEIPDEICEEAEDDDNFASPLSSTSLGEKVFTALSPPPSGVRTPPVNISGNSTDKPLPQLPEEYFPLVPAPLRIEPVGDFEPGSHFSTSTISTTLSSPTPSQHEFSSPNSVCDSIDEEDLTADMDISSGDEFRCSPVSPFVKKGMGFSGYSLPDSEYASELTIRKGTPMGALSGPASRTTFGDPVTLEPEADISSLSTLEDLLSDMRYLGQVIAK